MARRKMLEYLIDRDTITEELKLIDGSSTDYITPTGNVYKDYGNNKFFHKANFINKTNGYVYCNITFDEGQKQRRVHKLVAQAYIPNPNNLPVVMHLDNNKENCCVNNLKWGTVSENTQQAFDDGLQVNDASWNDSQSVPVCCFDLNQKLINKYGSISEAATKTGMTKTGILYQCNHKMKSKPRKGFYFRYLSEYESNGFVL